MSTMKTKVLNGSINIGTLTVSLDTLNNIVEAIKSNTHICQVRIFPEHDVKLSILAKKKRYEYNLSAKSGLNKTSLVYLILENVLKNVEV